MFVRIELEMWITNLMSENLRLSVSNGTGHDVINLGTEAAAPPEENATGCSPELPVCGSVDEGVHHWRGFGKHGGESG